MKNLWLYEHITNGSVKICVEEVLSCLSVEEVVDCIFIEIEAIKPDFVLGREEISSLVMSTYEKISRTKNARFVEYKDMYSNELYDGINFLNEKCKFEEEYCEFSSTALESILFILRKVLDAKLVKFNQKVIEKGLDEALANGLSIEDTCFNYLDLSIVLLYAYRGERKINKYKDFCNIVSFCMNMQYSTLAYCKDLLSNYCEENKCIDEMKESFIKEARLLKIKENKINEENNDLKDKITKYKIQVKDLVDKNTKLEKTSESTKKLNSLDVKLSDISNLIKKKAMSDKDIKAIASIVNETKYKTLERTFESQLGKLTDLIADLKIENKRLKTSNNEFEAENKKLKEMSDFREKEVSVCEINIDESKEAEKEVEVKKVCSGDKFAIVQKNSDGYYAYNTLFNLNIKLENIEDSKYLVNGQLVRLDSNNNIRCAINAYSDKKIFNSHNI